MRPNEMLNNMIVIAANAHNGQFDRGGKPYFLHVMQVMHLLQTDDEELNCMAVGHDVIEDTDTTYQDLRDAGMTERVIEGIKTLTKVKGQTYEEYCEGLFKNRDAMMVKKCDLRHNSDIRRIKEISQKDVDRTVKYRKLYTEIENRLRA